MFGEYYEKLLNQLSIEYNCAPEDLKTRGKVITVSKLNDGRRSYSPGVPFLQMVTVGGNTVIMADECLHEFLNDFVKDVEGIGSYLVTLLKNKVIEMGDVPFYGTAAANTQSQNIAINSGFKPAWVETEAVKIDGE